MAQKKKISVADVQPLIEQYRGNVAAISRHLKVHRHTVQARIDESTTLQQELQDARESMIDHVESSLYSAALGGAPWAVQFFLRTQGYHRGYGDRSRVEHEGEISNPDAPPAQVFDVSKLTIDQLEVIVKTAGPPAGDGGDDGAGS